MIQRHDSTVSIEHVNGEESPSSLAFLVTDVSHRDEQVRNTYTRIYQGMLKRLAALQPDAQREYHLALTAMMIGGVAVARAIDDEALQKELLAGCRQLGLELLGQGSGE